MRGSTTAIGADDAAALALELYGLEARATPLPGEHDLNFRLRDEQGISFVLKLHRPDRDPDELDLQDRALLHVARQADAFLDALDQALAEVSAQL
jgi:Ser/Thr protein kinase RdoA (MazF antagonist)